MKRKVFAAMLLCTIAVASHAAQEGRIGLGVIFGEPTGISGQLLTSERNAINAAVAWSFRRNGHFHFHADYLWQFPDIIRASEQFTLFAGIGGRLAAGRGGGVLGLRFVGGVSWLPQNSPLEVFLEVAPILNVLPATELDANGGVGLRFFFW